MSRLFNRAFMCAAVGVLLLSIGGRWALADPPAKEGIKMRIVSIKAGGKLQGKKPSMHPNIKAYKEILVPLGYDRYRGLDAEIHGPTRKELVEFRRLPLGYAADVRWSRKKAKLSLAISITRPGPKPKDKPIKVVDLRVDTPQGQHFMIRLQDAYPDGDMLFLVTAQLEPIE